MLDKAKIHALIDARIDAIPGGIPLPDDEIATSWGVGSASWSEGTIAIYNLLIGRSNCGERKILDVSGVGVTGNDGVATFNLSDFHCYFPPPSADPGSWEVSLPINVVATPRGVDPTYLTAEAEVGIDNPLPHAFDIAIAIYSWRPNGRPRKSVRFDWRCRVIVRFRGEFDRSNDLRT